MTFRIAVISDTHVPRFARRVPDVVARLAAERPDFILHCGDFTEAAAAEPFAALAPFDAVAGNNDGPAIVERFGRVKECELAGLRIGLVHGDGARGSTLDRARAAFAARRPDIICFGHSHIPYSQRHGETWLLNPGSPTDKRRQPRYSYALIDVHENGFAARLIFFD